MLDRVVSVIRGLDARIALAYGYVAAAFVYAVVYNDPYIVLLVTPFFALGCARGKHPALLLALALAPATALLVISIVKYLVLGLPLVTYDQYFLRTNLLILAYNDWRVAIGLILATVLALLYFWRLFAGRGPFSSFEKRGLAGLAVASIVCLVGMQTWDKEVAIWRPSASWPTLKNFVRSLQVSKPQLQIVSRAEAALTDTTIKEEKSFGPPLGPLPNLYFVLQESTFPPSQLTPGYESKALFAATADQRGPLRVHTFAGGTWRSEFALLTQMRPQEFGNDGLYIFHQLENRIHRSLFTELKKLGYRVIVFYPVPGSFINAEPFYRSIGADEFYDPATFGVASTWGAGWDWKFSDAVLYEAALKKTEGSAQPVVVLMLTINQHGPHDLAEPMADYTKRFAESDAAYEAFLEALQARGERAGVVAFGDHHPEFTARFLKENRELYITAYDIHCVNFACAGPSPGQREKALDLVMLAPAALEKFGFSLDTLSEEQRVSFKDCEDDTERCTETARVEFNTAFARFFE